MPEYINYIQLFWAGFELRETDPVAAVDAMLTVRDLAEKNNETRQVLFMNHWILQTQLFYSRDYKAASRLAVQAATQAANPIHADQMERICVYEDLIHAYVGTDPHGNTALIEDALAFMEREVTPDLQCWHCTRGARTGFKIAVGDKDAAKTAALRYLRDSEGKTMHHYASAHAEMCKVMHLDGDWAEMLQFATEAETLIKRTDGDPNGLLEAMAAKPLALHHLGEPKRAEEAYGKARRKAEASATLPIHYYEFACAYLHAVDKTAAALDLRLRQLNDMQGKGQPYWQADCHLHIARLRKYLGQPYAADLEAARTLAAELRLPAVILDQVAAFESSEPSN